MAKKIQISFFFSFISLLLCACQTTGSTTYHRDSHHAVMATTLNSDVHKNHISDELKKRLKIAHENKDTQEILSIYQEIHSDNPTNVRIAISYAKFLVDDRKINAAIDLLTSFVEQGKQNKKIFTELALIQIEAGNYEAAQKNAQKAIELDSENARAYLALGTALDAQNQSKKAERAFRKGLEYWDGDATTIMNNLATNLASQGYLSQALSLLEKALEEAPNNLELERNRRIISTLLEETIPEL